MPSAVTFPLLLTLAGVVLLVVGLALVRRSGAQPAMARRLAGARQMRVGELLDLRPGDRMPARPVRVVGRIRCADPLVTADEDRLVALHRDVEVVGSRGGWRSIQRLRETRSFELWDHDGSLPLDPAAAREPLVALPHVWSGSPDELDASFGAALSRVAAEQGPLLQARATTRMVSIVDRLLVLAAVTQDGSGRAALAPPPGGYIVSALELDDAMRLLGGRRPRMLLVGSGAVAAAIALFGVAAILGIARLAAS